MPAVREGGGGGGQSGGTTPKPLFVVQRDFNPRPLPQSSRPVYGPDMYEVDQIRVHVVLERIPVQSRLVLSARLRQKPEIKSCDNRLGLVSSTTSGLIYSAASTSSLLYKRNWGILNHPPKPG